MRERATLVNFSLAKKMMLALLVAAASVNSFAVITCTALTPSSANFAYVANTDNSSAGQSGLNNVVQNNVSFSCTRTTANPSLVRFEIDSGLNAGGGSNRAVNGTNRIRYNTYKDAACNTSLSNNNNDERIPTTLTGPLNAPETVNITFYTCIKIAQALTSFPAGTYVDTAKMGLRYRGGAAIDVESNLAVSINAPAVCSINGLPASNTIPLTYTAFQNTAAFNFASFNAACTNLLPYTMAVNPTSGVVGGLNYQLGLSSGATSGSATNIGTTPLNDIGGSSGTKMHYINAVMQAGQAGQVGAPLSNGHTLTITY